MRTTLDIDTDVLQAAKELAQREHSTAGRVLSELARRGLATPVASTADEGGLRNGVPVIPAQGRLVTVAKVELLLDQEGI